MTISILGTDASLRAIRTLISNSPGGVPLYDQFIALVNESPTLVQQLTAYDAQDVLSPPIIQTIAQVNGVDDLAGDNHDDGGLRQIAIGVGTTASPLSITSELRANGVVGIEDLVGVLAHELGHFTNYTANLNFVNAIGNINPNADKYDEQAIVGLNDESFAILNNFVVSQEVASYNTSGLPYSIPVRGPSQATEQYLLANIKTTTTGTQIMVPSGIQTVAFEDISHDDATNTAGTSNEPYYQYYGSYQ
jgi:hypothetical protein